MLGLDDPSTDETYGADFSALLRFLDVTSDPSVPLAMLAQLAYSPWAGLPGVPHLAVAVAGDTGIRKSAMAGIVTGAQSRLWAPVDGDADRATVNVRHGASSKIGMDRLLYHLAGGVAVVDDAFAGNLAPGDVRAQWMMLSGLAQSMATQKGGTKATRDGVGIRTDRYPRCCLLVTAEDYPDEDQHGSEIARYLALRANGEVDTAVLTEVQQSIRAISRAHARMIQDGLADLTAAPRAIAWAREQAADWERNGHNRARHNAILAVAGVRLLADGWERAGLGSGEALALQGADIIHEIADAQARRCGMTRAGQTARNPVVLFTRRFREMLRDGTWYLASPTRGPDNAALPPVIPSYSPGVAGWRQGAVLGGPGGTQWFPAGRGDPLGAVRVWGGSGRSPWRHVMLVIRSSEWGDIADMIRRRVRERDGWPMPAAEDLLRMLVDEGWVKEATAKPSALWNDEPKPRVLKLDLGRLLEIPESDGQDDDSRDDLGSGGGGSGGGREVTDLVSEFDPRCLACGEMTGARESEDGAYRWNEVEPLQASCAIPEPKQAEPAQAIIPEQVKSEQVPEPAWQGPGHTGKSLSALRATLVRRGWDVPSDEFVRAVADRITAAFPVDGKPGSGGPGLVWAEGPGRTGYRLFRQEQSHGTRRLPPDERLGDVNCPWVMPRQEWHRPLTDDERQQPFFVSFDINGAYLAAASQPLGTGRPVHLTDTGRITIRKNVPALYRLDVDPTTAGLLPMLVAANGWYASPIAWYLHERGLVRRVEEALVWPTTESYVWLDRWYQAIRDARSWLASDGGHDQAGRAAADCVKALYTTFLAGWMASPKNSTNLYRPDWRAHTVSRAAANQARALDTVREQTGRTPFAIRVDAVWFTANSPDDIPTGLQIPDNKKLGKWKPNGAGPITPNITATLDSGIGGVHAALREAATS
ncbi:hypothetical protein [Candidatus Frankia alpina]|uniref:DUF927 domain-containing protein n=1 Tax=Candidatus Frankia alpina TaxID=2699483 RepID=A0A4S5EPT6_9ACTN|nr:hypothetical protein [Candidatus Frankia alpina]THJ74266.1 hypothetical protein E7Y31_12450 [Candidatus Frankia alpina]